MMIERQVTVCAFYTPDDARDAVAAMREAGFPAEAISLLAPEAAVAVEADTKGERAREGAAAGAVAGAFVGGLAGWLIGLGTVAVPGVGPFIAAGALATAIGGAIVGAGLGAVGGAPVSMGLPEDEARYYEREVRTGRSLVTVRNGQRAEQADQIMHSHGGYDVQHGQRAPAASGATSSQR
jgi:uncharacterized membrane protein